MIDIIYALAVLAPKMLEKYDQKIIYCLENFKNNNDQ